MHNGHQRAGSVSDGHPTAQTRAGEFHGGSVVRGTCVRVSNDAARVGIPGQEPPAEPRIEIVRSGDVIQAIDIFCGCGQHIRLHCLYQEGIS